jgi:hypothetical protein
MSNIVDGLQKVAMYVDCLLEAYAEHMWTGMEIILVVCIGFSLAGCTQIRITTTLGYE